MKWTEIKINQKYRDWFKKTQHSIFNIVEGGVRSGKTTFLVLAFCRHLETIKRNSLSIAFAESISTAKVILQEGGNELGILTYFGNRASVGKFEGKDAIFVRLGNYTHTIIVAGSAKSDNYKMIRGLTVTSVIGTEANLAHEAFMQEVVARTLHTSTEERRIFLDFNPTMSTHYIYTEFVDRWLEEQKLGKLIGGVNYLNVSLYDNPGLSQEQATTIASQYDTKSNWYKALVLGMRVSAEDNVYSLYPYNLLEQQDMPKKYDYYIIGVDIGMSMSATTFVTMGVLKNKLYIDNFYYHRNGQAVEGPDIKLPLDYAEDLADYILKENTRLGTLPLSVFTDQDINFLRTLLPIITKKGIAKSLIKYAIKDKILDRIVNTQSLLYKGDLMISKKCDLVIKALSEAIYDPQFKERGQLVRLDTPALKFNSIDLIDSIEYCTSFYVRKLRGE
jgi:PBSX family phage terminase large subunit